VPTIREDKTFHLIPLMDLPTAQVKTDKKALYCEVSAAGFPVDSYPVVEIYGVYKVYKHPLVQPEGQRGEPFYEFKTVAALEQWYRGAHDVYHNPPEGKVVMDAMKGGSFGV
jgi:hypothetical protein